MYARTTLIAALAIAAGAHAQTFEIEIDSGEVERRESPLTLALRRDHDLPADLDIEAAWTATVRHGSTKRVAQTEPYFGDGRLQGGLLVRWIEPTLAAGVTRRTLTLEPAPPGEAGEQGGDRFRLRLDADRLDLLFGGRLVWRHETAWDSERYDETYKPFHHFGAFSGLGYLTKGPGGTHSHHRGLHLGWGRTGVGGESHNFWHMPATGRPYQRHLGYGAAQAGPVIARSASTTHWITDAGAAVVEDERELLTWRLDDGWLVDVAIDLRALGEKVELDGDPAHGGFQFRAAQSVADSESCTYVRPGGAVDEGNDNWSDCPWVAARFPIGDRRYEVLFLDHPSNPRPTVFNTRAYGRFGAFFRATLEPEEDLHLRYRLRIREEATDTGGQAEDHGRQYEDLVTPPQVRVLG